MYSIASLGGVGVEKLGGNIGIGIYAFNTFLSTFSCLNICMLRGCFSSVRGLMWPAYMQVGLQDPRLRVPCQAIIGFVDSGSGLDSRMTGEGRQGESEYGKGTGGDLSRDPMVVEAETKMSVKG